MSKYITHVFLTYRDSRDNEHMFQAFTPEGAELGGIGYSGHNPEFGEGYVKVYCPTKSIIVPLNRVISIEVQTVDQ